MTRPILTLAGEVYISGHAIGRYIERVKPAYTSQHAHWELARLTPITRPGRCCWVPSAARSRIPPER